MFQLKQRFLCCVIPLVIFLVTIVGGCSDDDPTQPNDGTIPTLTSIWPAGVGHYWVFDISCRQFESMPQLFERLEDVPPIPSMEELYALLQADPTGNMVSEGSGDYKVEFTGEDLSVPEVEAFQVERAWDNVLGGYLQQPWPLSLLPTWTRSSDRIAVYRDSSRSSLGWMHLDRALNPGHEFRVQLVENLTDDLFLSSRIWKYRSFKVMGQEYENCLESFYVLDQGIQQATDENGMSMGYSRTYGYGVIIYAPGIGPVYCMEKGISGCVGCQEGSAEFERVATLLDQGESEILFDKLF